MQGAEVGSVSGRSVEGSALARVGDFAPTDPSDQEYATFPWEILIRPAARGPYRHRMTYVATPSLILYHERYDATIRVCGLTPSNHLSVALPVRPSPDSRYWNAPQSTPGFLCALPREVSAYIGKGHEHLMFLADRGLLRRHLSEAQLQILERADREHVLPGSPFQVDGLRAWALRSLRQFRARPETLNHPAAVQALEDDYVQWLCSAVDAIAPVAAKRLNPALRQLGVKRALEYLRSAGNGAVTVPSLCEGIGVSQRTLQYAFRETFGVSPLGYLRLQRLHAVRRQLMLGSRGETTVATVACEHGFYELGRFAAIYAKTFGERPSETLSRQFRISGQVFAPDTTGNNQRY